MHRMMHLMARLSLGKEMANALLVLRLVAEALQSKNVGNLASFVFRKLPAQFRHPEGPATEAEFVAMIEVGEQFLRKVRAVMTR